MKLEELINSGFPNINVIETFYARYQIDPWSLGEEWRSLFSQLEASTRNPLPASLPTEKASGSEEQISRVHQWIDAYRTYGHLAARTNPLYTHSNQEPRQLTPETLGYRDESFVHFFRSVHLLTSPRATLNEILACLKNIYCSGASVEYMGLGNAALKEWIQAHIEPKGFHTHLSSDQKKKILHYLSKSELFESFLHTKYVGQKRFSLEGAETLIPMLAALIDRGAALNVQEFVIGMAHRGRLNVLANILNKSYGIIFAEFDEGYIPDSFEGSGDVKYHKGYTSKVKTQEGRELALTLAPNPSHLESVFPVVEGQVRAKQALSKDQAGGRTAGVIIHGDAAISGQGIVYETLQMSGLSGYSTGGTIHIVINNQIGFTTVPEDARSTFYCTDIARAFQAPIFHLNAEDPEGCVYATLLAIELRQRFRCDVFLDLMCYRKYGHNESDEPAFTQPREYQLIKAKKPIRELYRDELIGQGVLDKQEVEALEEQFKHDLNKALSDVQKEPAKHPISMLASASPAAPIPCVPLDTLKEVGKRICRVPSDLEIHKKLEKLVSERLEMAQGVRPVDWGMAELLAYATLLEEGIHVRLSGQDSCRGTFSHRHAVWMDQRAEKGYAPLQHLKEGQGLFEIYNSPLSEYAVLGFDYGYSVAYPAALVIWEAQFGDFCNGAQVIIDQFISTSEMKWAQRCRLTLFLPHGYEGQGPEHSSARMERFLALCADNNMQVANPTLPAQLYHLLRKQTLQQTPKPLVVFTPKGLLRYPACVSPLSDFSSGAFQPILQDSSSPEDCRTLVFCSGRIFYDLFEERKRRGLNDFALVRLEQLYPLEEEAIQSLFRQYNHAERVVWAQEEPQNMGAWSYIQPLLQKLAPAGRKVEYVGRPRSASPAAGSYALHKKEHAKMIQELFDYKGPAS